MCGKCKTTKPAESPYESTTRAVTLHVDEVLKLARWKMSETKGAYADRAVEITKEALALFELATEMDKEINKKQHDAMRRVEIAGCRCHSSNAEHGGEEEETD